MYERSYSCKRPVVCLDEKPLQLLGEVRESLPMRPGAVEKIDAEYKRNGTCSIFALVEPLTGHHVYDIVKVPSVTFKNPFFHRREFPIKSGTS